MAGKSRGNQRLTAVRKRIDRLDERILRFVNQRAALALLIGRIKKRKRWPVYDPTREAFVLRHVSRANRGPLSSPSVQHIFRAILRQCRRRERKIGPPSTIHHPRKG